MPSNPLGAIAVAPIHIAVANGQIT